MDGSLALWALLERKYALPVVLHADDSPAVLFRFVVLELLERGRLDLTLHHEIETDRRVN